MQRFLLLETFLVMTPHHPKASKGRFGAVTMYAFRPDVDAVLAKMATLPGADTTEKEWLAAVKIWNAERERGVKFGAKMDKWTRERAADRSQDLSAIRQTRMTESAAVREDCADRSGSVTSSSSSATRRTRSPTACTTTRVRTQSEHRF